VQVRLDAMELHRPRQWGACWLASQAAVYQRHQFMSERKEALEKWGAHVAQILSLALAEERWGLGRVA
jgi:hypothetical protein